MRLLTTLNGMAAGLAATLLSGAAHAQNLEIIGQPVPKGMGFQPDGTELARDLYGLDHLILYIITAIVIFVTALLVYAVVRFRQKANPTPARFSHYTPIEIVWTLVPILILIVIGSFSLPVLFKQQTIPEGDVTIKVTGNQWYWSYEYVDDGVAFDSYMIGSPATGGTNQMTPDVEKQLVDAGYSKEQFLLATDTAVVVPVGKTVVMQVTGSDVIHSWKIPAFGVMQDGVPGRLAQLWFTPEKEGIYFGQCSELCGQMHAYMPITVKVVSQATVLAASISACDSTTSPALAWASQAS
jgi:cytochrome c oxidase subunit 2